MRCRCSCVVRRAVSVVAETHDRFADLSHDTDVFDVALCPRARKECP